jgi:hypothetical protein
MLACVEDTASPTCCTGASGDAALPEPPREETIIVDEKANLATPPPIESWPRYVLAPGAHVSSLVPGERGNPLGGLVRAVTERAYALAFDASAMYVLTAPTQPDDQLDWNKLPGLSDCGTVDLAVDGLMFGWRWRLDTSPNQLEITAYANNAGVHLTAKEALVALDETDVTNATPLNYRLSISGAEYRFSIFGEIRGRRVDASSVLPRRCADVPPSTLDFQWASSLYFGGTSTSPQTIETSVFEWPR